MTTPEEVHLSDLVVSLAVFEEVFVRPGPDICHCGVEITPDMPEHIMCYPGME